MSVARFIADQRTMHGVPHTFTCAILGVSVLVLQVVAPGTDTDRDPPRRARRRGQGLLRGVQAHLRVAADPPRSRRGRLDGEREHRRRLDATTRIARSEAEAAQGIDPAGQGGAEGPGSAEAGLRRGGAEREVVRRHDRDPHRRGQALLGHRSGPVLSRVAGSPTSEHPDAELACDAIKMAAAVRGGRAAVDGVIFHTDYAEVCVKPRICGDGLRSWELLVDFSA